MAYNNNVTGIDIVLCVIERTADIQHFPIDEHEGYTKACRLITKHEFGVINNKQKQYIINELDNICTLLGLNLMSIVSKIAKEAWSK